MVSLSDEWKPTTSCAMNSRPARSTTRSSAASCRRSRIENEATYDAPATAPRMLDADLGVVAVVLVATVVVVDGCGCSGECSDDDDDDIDIDIDDNEPTPPTPGPPPIDDDDDAENELAVAGSSTTSRQMAKRRALVSDDAEVIFRFGAWLAAVCQGEARSFAPSRPSRRL